MELELKFKEKVVSYTYTLLKFVEWAVDHALKKNGEGFSKALRQFESENIFDVVKLKLLPHYVCTVNGNRDKMFRIFNSFCADEKIGYVENDISYFIDQKGDDNKLFTALFKIDNNKLELRQTELEKLFDENRKLDLDRFYALMKVTVDDPDKTIEALEKIGSGAFEEINGCIESFKRQDYYNDGGFLLMHGTYLSKFSKMHFHYMLYANKVLKYENNDKPEVELAYLVNEKSIFSEYPRKQLKIAVLDC